MNLQESIKFGFNHSYFVLSRLYHEIFNENEKAFETAKEGSKNNGKYSKCLYGYFLSHGIGTKKEFKRGVQMILESEVSDFYERFATDIGLYFIDLSKEKVDEKEECENEAFKWFEKAFNIQKTNATINNYGICFLKGIGVKKNIEKAIEIFTYGISQNNPNSLYHLAFIYEEIDPKKSLELYKKSSELGNMDARARYALRISNT